MSVQENNRLNYENLLEKYRLLNLVESRLFKLYGLRQIKYMFEEDLNKMEKPPEGFKLVGLNDFGRWIAINEEETVKYGYFKSEPEGERWSQALTYVPSGAKELTYDKVEHFEKIYKTFELNKYDKKELTYLASNFLMVLNKEIHPFQFSGGVVNLTKDI